VLAPGFPFSEVEILRDHFIVAQPSNQDVFTPLEGGEPLQFPLRCAAADGDVYFAMPLVFVSNTAPRENVEAVLGTNIDINLSGTQIDLVHSPVRQAGDIHEVHHLSVTGIPHGGGGIRPKLSQVQVKLPALRTLLPDHDKLVPLTFTTSEDVPLELVNGAIDVDFTKHADRSGGLVSPKFKADGISREFGPIARDALSGSELPDLSSVYGGATLLGLPLASVIKVDAPPDPPTIVQVPHPESEEPPGVRMEWNDLKLESHGPLEANNATLDLTVETSQSKSKTTCKVEKNFSLVLPANGKKLLRLTFDSLVFTQEGGRPPDLQINNPRLEFLNDLRLLQTIQTELDKIGGLGGNTPAIHAAPSGITASYGLSIPSVQALAFLIRNIALRFGVDVPFDGRPVTVSLSFASRDNPFNLSVLMFGGGGYIDIQIGPTGLTQLEASMEFGAAVAVDFIVASGEVHALGGLHLVKRGDSVVLAGFIRFGGSIEVLGLVSASVELLVALQYESEGNRMVGRATLVLEIDLTLYSDSVELDSGEWVLSGEDREPVRPRGPASPVTLALPTEEPDLTAWQAYQEAFAT
jgi:hypothetical protein